MINIDAANGFTRTHFQRREVQITQEYLELIASESDHAIDRIHHLTQIVLDLRLQLGQPDQHQE